MLQVPFPNEPAFDPTASPGACDAFKALKHPETGLQYPIIEAMETAYAGDQDADIHYRYFQTGLPAIRGNQKDSITDLPLALQTKLQNISNVVIGAVSDLKTYSVGVHLPLFNNYPSSFFDLFIYYYYYYF